MKKSLLLSLLILPFYLHTFSQGQYYHTIKIGSMHLVVNAAITTSNGFYIAGSADSMAYVLSANDSGVIQWTQLISNTGSSAATGLVMSYTNKLVSSGYVPQQAGNKVYCLTAFTPTGDTLKTTTLNDGPGDDFTGALTQLKDSTYVITGMGPHGLAVIHVNKNSNPISATGYGPMLADHNQKIIPLSNGGFIIVCNNSNATGGTQPNFRLLRFDGTGALAWAGKYPVQHGITVNNIIATSDHGLLVCGSYSDSTNMVNRNLMLAKINTSGTIVWANTYTNVLVNANTFNSVVQTADGGFAAYGSIGGAVYGSSDNVLLKTDSAGNIAWAKTYGLFSSDSGYIVTAYKKGYVLFGYGYDNTGGYIEVIATDTLGNTACHYDSIHLQKNTVALTLDTLTLTGTPLSTFSTLQADLSIGSAVTDTICPLNTSTPFTYHHLLDEINIWNYAHYVCLLTPPPGGGGNQRSLFDCGINLTTRGTVFTYTDSLINGATYKSLVVDHIINDTQLTDSCRLGFIREDTTTGKIYFIGTGTTQPVLLYDFSMHVGDSIYISINNDSLSGYYKSGYYVLNLIDTVRLGNGNARQFNLNNRTGGGHTLSWVEGVGSLADIIYIYGINETGCPDGQTCPGNQHSLSYFVTCFEHQQKVYFDSCQYASVHPPDSCNYTVYGGGGINELSSLSSFTAYPNPTSNQVTVQLNVAQSAAFDIYVNDITGKCVTNHLHLGQLNPGLHNAQVDLSTLSPGFYLIECRTAAGSLYSKLVKQ